MTWYLSSNALNRHSCTIATRLNWWRNSHFKKGLYRLSGDESLVWVWNLDRLNRKIIRYRLKMCGMELKYPRKFMNVRLTTMWSKQDHHAVINVVQSAIDTVNLMNLSIRFVVAMDQVSHFLSIFILNRLQKLVQIWINSGKSFNHGGSSTDLIPVLTWN